MVMCADGCTCKWCKVMDMMDHPQFKERMDILLAEFDLVWIPKKVPVFYDDDH